MGAAKKKNRSRSSEDAYRLPERLRRVNGDPLTYGDEFAWIRSKTGEVIPFRANGIQRKIHQAKIRTMRLGRPMRYLILKARRQGVSTYEQLYSYWLVSNFPHQQAVTLAHDKDSAEKIFRMVTLFYDRTPEVIRPHRLTAHNKRDLNLDKINSLYYVGTAGSKAFGRGDTLNRVHWSEVAWSPGDIEDQRRLASGLTEACSHGEVVLETTPNGVGDYFHETWKEALDGNNEWTPIFFRWWDDPTYRHYLNREQQQEIFRSLTDKEKSLVKKFGLTPDQISWRRAKKTTLKKLFQQEYPEDSSDCFITSGLSFFDAKIISSLFDRCPPVEEGVGGLTIFHEPEAGQHYVIGGDVGEGNRDSDWSVATVLEKRTMRQMAVLRVQEKPERFAHLVAKLGKRYNNALVAIERNNHGHSCLNTLFNQIKYGNLYYHVDYDNVSGTTSEKLGWPTTTLTRPLMLDDLKAAVEDGDMKVADRVFLQECQTFVRNKSGKYEAREGQHDDTVMANAIAVQALSNYSTPRVTIL